MKRNGFFITFEGIDGSGKTTQLEMAEDYLKSKDLPVLVIREPGSTPLSEKVRKILLDHKSKLNPHSELMLYLAARAELVEKVIAPALIDGKTILCDRFYDSTTAYQGYGRNLDISLITKMNQMIVDDCEPDLTILLDIDLKSFHSRRIQADLFSIDQQNRATNKRPDRMDAESMEFHEKVRRGFLDIARKNKKRIVIVNAMQSIESVFEEVKACLNSRLKIN
jgi:dTMP kinase